MTQPPISQPKGPEYKKTYLVSLMSYGNYTLAEIKSVTALMYLAAEAQKTNPAQAAFQADIREITRLSGITYTHSQIREIIHGIQSKPVTLNFIGKHGSRVETGAILSWVGVYENDPIIDYEFPERIRSQLQKPDYYTVIKMAALTELGGKYAYILYELCKSYVRIGRTPNLEIEKFREFLGLTDEYPIFTDFKRCVILPAVREINDCDRIEISVCYKQQRVGKKIGFVYFEVAPKETKTPEAESEIERTLDRLMLLLPDTLQTPKNWEMLRGYLDKGEEYIISNIQYAWLNCKKPEKSYSSYLTKALQENWGHEICRIRELERELRKAKGEEDHTVKPDDMNPAADQIYREAYEDAKVEKKEEIRYEVHIKMAQGNIRKTTPPAMQIRLAMQYLGYWL